MDSLSPVLAKHVWDVSDREADILQTLSLFSHKERPRPRTKKKKD